MRVLLFGATGMIGGGALIECLADHRVTSVLVVGRSSSGVMHPKLTEIVHRDLDNLGPLTAPELGRGSTHSGTILKSVAISADGRRALAVGYTRGP